MLPMSAGSFRMPSYDYTGKENANKKKNPLPVADSFAAQRMIR